MEQKLKTCTTDLQIKIGFHNPSFFIDSSSANGTLKKKSGDSVKEASESNNSSGSIISVGRFKPSGIPSGSSLPSEAPLCRPWDRSDLLRRLATFKSMTWFGKPKVWTLHSSSSHFFFYVCRPCHGLFCIYLLAYILRDFFSLL